MHMCAHRYEGWIQRLFTRSDLYVIEAFPCFLCAESSGGCSEHYTISDLILFCRRHLQALSHGSCARCDVNASRIQRWLNEGAVRPSKHDTLTQSWLMLAQRRRRWVKISPALGQRVGFSGRQWTLRSKISRCPDHQGHNAWNLIPVTRWTQFYLDFWGMSCSTLNIICSSKYGQHGKQLMRMSRCYVLENKACWANDGFMFVQHLNVIVLAHSPFDRVYLTYTTIISECLVLVISYQTVIFLGRQDNIGIAQTI